MRQIGRWQNSNISYFMVKEVLIRVDGGASIGLGHVVRCMSLAYMLQEDFQITFYVKELPDSMATKILEDGFKIIFLESEEDFLKSLKGNEIVVLDHYGLGSDIQKSIKQNGSFLVCIDDIPEKKFYADLIINHAPGITSKDYEAKNYTRFALGLDYALLRPQFLKIARDRNFVKDSDHLFICFGGSDKKNLTTVVLEVAMKMTKYRQISVVLGQAFDRIDGITILAKEDPRVRIHTALDEQDLVRLMKRAGVAVVPASGILMEALATGCKVVSGMYVENQSHVYEQYKNSNFFLDAGNFQAAEVRTALSQVASFDVPENVIDGKSGERIRRLFKSIQLEENIKIRKATIDDLKLTYSWAANAELRQHSFTKKEIPYEEHVEWFTGKIKDSNCLYLIAEENGRALGSLRYDISAGTALISYLVDPSFQGRGLGIVLLRKAFSWLSPYSNDVDHVVGYVMPENIASQKSFRRLGYLEEFQEKEKKYKYSKKLT